MSVAIGCDGPTLGGGRTSVCVCELAVREGGTPAGGGDEVDVN